jgi:hypothetical protein
MKNTTVLAFFTLVGVIIGYVTGKVENAVIWLVILNMFFGGFLFWQLGRAFIAKYYIVITGPIVGLVISIASDLLAGSEVTLRFKLIYMMMGLFGMGSFRKYGKPWLVGIVVGGILGFVWGLNDSRMFGNVSVPPGMLNASLMAVQVAMAGMSWARIFAELVEQKFFVKRNPPS